MASRSIIDKPPGKALRLGLRLPIWLYRARLGWLLDDRFLMLTHTGRKSGLPRRTVIEVVRHDRQADTYYVVSGWGEKSDWYQNIKKNPDVTVQVGGREFRATAEFIPLDEAIEILGSSAQTPNGISGAKRAIPGRAHAARQRRPKAAGRKNAHGGVPPYIKQRSRQ